MNIETNKQINKSIIAGLKSFERPVPMRLSEYADKYFYLSAESSYVQGKWETLPYQRSIMDCLSNDDIREITLQKSARIGYTKIILASINYHAEHKKRNQGIWQPVDGDAEEFCKTEIDPMIRDVPKMQDIFPWHNKKHKNNTIKQKVFNGSTLYIRGGKSAKNYRRVSVDIAYGDELDAFDRDVDKEGSPRKLYGKRVEGAIFPKIVNGSTPKIKGSSLIEETLGNMEYVFRYHIPCPKCKHMHPLIWGGKDYKKGGMKWKNNDPHTVKQECPKCKNLYTQADYLKIADKGKYISTSVIVSESEKQIVTDGVWIDEDCIFRNKHGKIVDTPQTVGFHVWTAYSPMCSWAQIIREWLDSQGNPSELKTFINQTLGETWEEDESEKLEHELLYHRREYYLAQVPAEVAVITADKDRWVDEMMKEELEMMEQKKSPFAIGAVTYISFLLVGMIPLSVYVLDAIKQLPYNLFLISSILTSIGFIIIGLLKTFITETGKLKGIAETLFLGALAALVAYFVGDILEHLVLG